MIIIKGIVDVAAKKVAATTATKAAKEAEINKLKGYKPDYVPVQKPTVWCNNLSDKELSQANEIVENMGGQFTGVPKLTKGVRINPNTPPLSSTDYPVIDGWLNLNGKNFGVSLKEFSGSNPIKILSEVKSQNVTGSTYKINNVTMYVNARNMEADKLINFANNGSLTKGLLNEGSINRVIVNTKEGYVTIQNNVVYRGLPKN